MNTFSNHRATFIWLGILLPLWLVVGRAAIGSIGWMTIALATVGSPLLGLPLMIALLFFFLPDVRVSKHLRPEHAKLLWMTHGLLFAMGFFLVDFGDTEGSDNSVFSIIFGRIAIELSMFLGFGFGILGIIAVLASLFVVVREGAIARGKARMARQQAELTRKAP